MELDINGQVAIAAQNSISGTLEIQGHAAVPGREVVSMTIDVIHLYT